MLRNATQLRRALLCVNWDDCLLFGIALVAAYFCPNDFLEFESLIQYPVHYVQVEPINTT